MRAYIFDENNKVVNVILVDSEEDAQAFGAVLLGNLDLHIGLTYSDGVITDEDGNVRDPSEFMNVVLGQEVLQEITARIEADVDRIGTNMVIWNSLTEDQKTELQAYRQSLLDVKTQEGFPVDVTWPTKPEWIEGI